MSLHVGDEVEIVDTKYYYEGSHGIESKDIRHGSGPQVGAIGLVTKILGRGEYVIVDYKNPGGGNAKLGFEVKKSLKVIRKNGMNLKDKMALVFKGEPQKSFIKAGVMNNDETLTEDGRAVFEAWLLKKHGDEFKKEVVDLILADEPKE